MAKWGHPNVWGWKIYLHYQIFCTRIPIFYFYSKNGRSISNSTSVCSTGSNWCQLFPWQMCHLNMMNRFGVPLGPLCPMKKWIQKSTQSGYLLSIYSAVLITGRTIAVYSCFSRCVYLVFLGGNYISRCIY